MKIVNAGFELLTGDLEIINAPKAIEVAGRTCYKSEDRITVDSADKFVRMLRDRGHEAMLEHGPSISVRFIVDRGVTHEMVRHRVASFAQESTRYCNYGKDKFGEEITVILPSFFDTGMGIHSNSDVFTEWKTACERAESAYFELLKMGATPQQARSVLPNSLKAEIIITANIREWRHILKLRTSEAAHPQIREVMTPLLWSLQSLAPCLFDDIEGCE